MGTPGYPGPDQPGPPDDPWLPEEAPPPGAPPTRTPTEAPAPQGRTRPGTAVRRRPPSPARQKVLRKRRRRRRALVGFTFLTTVCTFVTGVGVVYLRSRLDQVRRVSLANLAGDSSTPVMNILLVGSDAQSGAGAQPGPGPRGDLLLLFHVDEVRRRAAVVSIPRDLYIPVPGAGTQDRVTATLAAGGADQLLGALQEALGVRINHYVQIDYAGIAEVVDALGGVVVYVPYPVRDVVSGLALEESGCVRLGGREGLAWLRSTQAEFLVDGRWQTDGRGALGRQERQQDLVRRIIRRALGPPPANPLTLNRLVGAAVEHATFDARLSTQDLNRLGRRLGPLDEGQVALATLPTIPADILGQAILLLERGRSQPLLDLLNGEPTGAVPQERPPGPATATETTPATGATAGAPGGNGPTTTAAPEGAAKPAEVRVRVLNGVGTPGAAAKAATSLSALGFVIADKGDATSITPKTTILYASGQGAKAQVLQGSLVTPAVLREDPTLRAVDVNLILGGDYTGVKAGISSGASGATTTVTAAPTVAPVTVAPLPARTGTPPC